MRGIEFGAIWHSPRDAEELEKVVELAVNITTDSDRGCYGLNV